MATTPEIIQELDIRLWRGNEVAVDGSDILTKNAPLVMYMAVGGDLVVLDNTGDGLVIKHFKITEVD